MFVYVDRAQSDASSSLLPSAIGDKYHISYKLGQGGFGEVSLLFNKVTINPSLPCVHIHLLSSD